MGQTTARTGSRRKGVGEVASEPAFRFEDILAGRSKDRSLPKRMRTHYLILAIVARYLNADPARPPTVELLLDEAGLSRGTFYNHFKDMDDCMSVLVGLFLETITVRGIKSAAQRSNYDAILDTNLSFTRAYEANAGLYALFSQLASRNLDLLRMRERLNADWVKRIVAVVAHRRSRDFGAEERSRFEGELRILIAMTIETLRERFVDREAMLCHSFPTTDSLAIALSDIWHLTMKRYEK
ncbi:TetR/AcrR family transcriptional regulator [Leptospira interrogans]